jgi:hypothetical protein
MLCLCLVTHQFHTDNNNDMVDIKDVNGRNNISATYFRVLIS